MSSSSSGRCSRRNTVLMLTWCGPKPWIASRKAKQTLPKYLYSDLDFVSVRIVTVAEGETSEMHIGFKDTMNAMFVKDLAPTTHRGMHRRVEAAKSGGGNAYVSAITIVPAG